jgi:hypothetical protein
MFPPPLFLVKFCSLHTSWEVDVITALLHPKINKAIRAEKKLTDLRRPRRLKSIRNRSWRSILQDGDINPNPGPTEHNIESTTTPLNIIAMNMHGRLIRSIEWIQNSLLPETFSAITNKRAGRRVSREIDLMIFTETGRAEGVFLSNQFKGWTFHCSNNTGISPVEGLVIAIRNGSDWGVLCVEHIIQGRLAYCDILCGAKVVRVIAVHGIAQDDRRACESFWRMCMGLIGRAQSSMYEIVLIGDLNGTLTPSLDRPDKKPTIRDETLEICATSVGLFDSYRFLNQGKRTSSFWRIHAAPGSYISRVDTALLCHQGGVFPVFSDYMAGRGQGHDHFPFLFTGDVAQPLRKKCEVAHQAQYVPIPPPLNKWDTKEVTQELWDNWLEKLEEAVREIKLRTGSVDVNSRGSVWKKVLSETNNIFFKPKKVLGDLCKKSMDKFNSISSKLLAVQKRIRNLHEHIAFKAPLQPSLHPMFLSPAAHPDVPLCLTELKNVIAEQEVLFSELRVKQAETWQKKHSKSVDIWGKGLQNSRSWKELKKVIRPNNSVDLRYLEREGVKITGEELLKQVQTSLTSQFSQLAPLSPNTSTTILKGTPTGGDITGEILVTEIAEAIAEGTGTSAPGPDGFTFEMYKKMGPDAISFLAIILNEALHTNRIPQHWKESETVMIFKKGNPYDLQNYRPITMGAVEAKILWKILLKRIVVGEKGPECQCPGLMGFIQNTSVESVALYVRSRIEQGERDKKRVFTAFLDVEKAYDNVNHEAIIRAWEGGIMDIIRLFVNTFRVIQQL